MTKNTSMRNPVVWLRGMALLCACAVLHCGVEAADLPSVQGQAVELALSPSNPQIAQETAQQFLLRGLYEDGQARDLTRAASWQVADDSGRPLVMPADGYLQLAQPGRYLVTVRWKDRELSTPIVVTAATVKSVAITPSAPRVAKGLTQPFTAIATFTDGTTQDVTKLATWAVKDVTGTGVATIDTTGMMLAKNVGKATITARYKTRSASTTAEVTAAALNLLFISPADPTIASGTSQKFTASGTFSDGTTTDLTTVATWAVTDLMGSGVAAIDGTGTANGKSVGTAQVSADYGGLTAETTLTVSPAVAIAVAISPSSSSIAKGTAQRFTATATLTDGTTQDVSALAAWTATDKTGTGVASIDTGGLAKGNAEGTATISCAYRGHTGSALLTVTPAVLTGLGVAPAMATVYKGQYLSLVATGTYSDGSTQDLSAAAVWSSADLMGTDIASVAASGRVFGKNLGKAKITATSGLYSASAVVQVDAPMYTGLAVSPLSAFAFTGLTVQFTATATLADGTTKDVSASTTWTVTDVVVGTGVATIDSKGLATGRSIGVARVHAAFGGYTGAADMYVLF